MSCFVAQAWGPSSTGSGADPEQLGGLRRHRWLPGAGLKLPERHHNMTRAAGRGWQQGAVGLLCFGKSQQQWKEDTRDPGKCMCLENVMDMAEGSVLSTALMSLLSKNHGQLPCLEGTVAEECCPAQKERDLDTKGVVGELQIIICVCT